MVPEGTKDLSQDPRFQDVLMRMEEELRSICDPEAVDAAAKAAQAALIERIGGKAAAFDVSKAMSGGTPPPKT